MKIVFVTLLLCISTAFAAFTITTIPGNGTPVTGTLPVPRTQDEYYTIKYYQVNITNGRFITFDLTNVDNAQCTSLNFYMSNSLPCNARNLDGSSSEFLCDNTYNPNGGVETTYSFTLDPRGVTNLEWTVGAPIYIGVARGTNDNATCTFSIAANVTTCATGTIGVYIPPIVSTICYPINPAPPGFLFPLADIPNNVSYYGLLNMPSNTAYLKGFVNATTPDLNMFGLNYGPPDGVSTPHCFTTTPDSQVGELYLYQLICLVPRSGPFYFFLFHDPAQFALFNASLYIDVKTCGAGTAGEDCQYPLTKYDATTDIGKEYSVDPGEWRYFYVDFTPGAGSTMEVTATANDSCYFYIRKNGFPADVSGANGIGYEFSDEYARIDDTTTARRVLTAADTYTGGRWFLAVNNDNTVPISFVVNATVTTPSPPTTPGTTEPTPTDDEDSSFAKMLLPSSLIAAILAFLSSFF